MWDNKYKKENALPSLSILKTFLRQLLSIGVCKHCTPSIPYSVFVYHLLVQCITLLDKNGSFPLMFGCVSLCYLSPGHSLQLLFCPAPPPPPPAPPHQPSTPPPPPCWIEETTQSNERRVNPSLYNNIMCSSDLLYK